jgi:hypothetical protein
MIAPEDDSCIALVEALVEDALRKQCIEAMAHAIYLTEATSLTYTTDYAKAALDAAIASGYVVVNKP